jgi:hypothetical protein
MWKPLVLALLRCGLACAAPACCACLLRLPTFPALLALPASHPPTCQARPVFFFSPQKSGGGLSNFLS